MMFLQELRKCSVIPVYDQSIYGCDSFTVKDFQIEKGNKQTWGCCLVAIGQANSISNYSSVSSDIDCRTGLFETVKELLAFHRDFLETIIPEKEQKNSLYS